MKKLTSASLALALILVCAPAFAAVDCFMDFGEARLSAGVNDSATSLTLITGGASAFASCAGQSFNVVLWNRTDFPDPGNPSSDREVVRVTAMVGDVLTVTRGAAGTTARAHNTAGKSYWVMRSLFAKDVTDILASAGSTSATYITETPDTTLTNEFALSTLATGILKNTTGTGVPSIAVAGDFPTLNQSTTGNAATATTAGALASDPSDCVLPQVAIGITANGTATCSQPSSVTGNAATATALAADPSDCGANAFATAIAASGNLTCSQPSTFPASTSTSSTINGTGGAGFVEFQPQSSNPSNPSSGYRMFADSTGRHAWKRASDGFVRTFDSTLTADRVYTWPDAATKIPIFGQFITFSGPTAGRTVTLPDGDTTVPSASQPFTFTGTTAGRTFTFVDQNDTFAFLATANAFTKKQSITSTAAAGADEPSQTITYTASNLNGQQEGSKITCDFTSAANGGSFCVSSVITAGNNAGSGPQVAFYGQVSQNSASGNHQFQGLVGVAHTSNSSNSSARMVGVIGRGGDTGSGNNGVHVGVIGYAKRASSSTNGAGVFAKISTATAAFGGTQSDVDPGTSAAIVANNGDTALPEYIGQNNGTTNWRIGSTGDVTGGSVKTLTESSATAFVALNVPNSDGCAGKVVYTVFAKDATNTQIVSGELFFSAVANSTGTVTAATLSDQHNLNPVSSGTLTNAMTSSTAANTLTLSSNAVSSLTQTTLEIRYRVESQGGNCSTITAQ